MNEQKEEQHIPFGCWLLGSILMVVFAFLAIVVLVNFLGLFSMMFTEQY
ncbi:MAG: hypothetical protein ACPG49_07390 [Chitinophagales bacterium]